MSRITVCANCLATFTSGYGRGLQIGAEYGNQRDPETDNVDLCPDCETPLRIGDFKTIHSRYRSERTLTVGENAVVDLDA